MTFAHRHLRRGLDLPRAFAFRFRFAIDKFIRVDFVRPRSSRFAPIQNPAQHRRGRPDRGGGRDFGLFGGFGSERARRWNEPRATYTYRHRHDVADFDTAPSPLLPSVDPCWEKPNRKTTQIQHALRHNRFMTDTQTPNRRTRTLLLRAEACLLILLIHLLLGGPLI